MSDAHDLNAAIERLIMAGPRSPCGAGATAGRCVVRALKTVGLLFLAVLCSGFVGGVTYCLQLAVVSAVGGSVGESGFAFFAAVIAVPAFMAGAAGPGVAAWLALCRTRWNRPLPAALTGGVVTALVGGLILLVSSGWEALPLALPFPLAGAVGGWMFQRLMANKTA